jgi:hypothetical protein
MRYLKKINLWLRGSYPSNAPRQGHWPLIALCGIDPSAARVVRMAVDGQNNRHI